MNRKTWTALACLAALAVLAHQALPGAKARRGIDLATAPARGTEQAPEPSYEDADLDLAKALVGVWQRSWDLGDGWDDVYRFFPDGRFVFSENEMTSPRRGIGHSGTWRLAGGQLILRTTEKEAVRVEPPAEERLPAAGLKRERRGEVSKLTVIIGGDRFWKHREDPADF